MVEGLVHVLIHVLVGRVEDGAILLVQVHQEAIFGHALLLLRWWTQERQTDTMNKIQYVQCELHAYEKTACLSILRSVVKKPKNPTCPIHLVFFNELDGVLHGRLLPLLIQQEVQQISGAHLTLCFSVLPINHIYLLPVRQQVVEVLDL